MNIVGICAQCQPSHVLAPNERLVSHGPECAERRADSGGVAIDLDAGRAAVPAIRFDAPRLVQSADRHPAHEGRRLDGSEQAMREDMIDPDVIAARMRQRNANAWKAQHSIPDHRTDAKAKKSEEDDAEPTIDPDAAAARMRKRNEDAWKGKSSNDLLGMLEQKDPHADKDGLGAFGMRHGRT